MSASVQKLTRSEREAPLLYSQRQTLIGGCGKPWHFKSLTVRHIYYRLAQSSAKLYELLKALKALDGDRTKKLFQSLNEIGARALRIQLGRGLEMAESSPDKFTYGNKLAERFGGQKELELMVPRPSVIPTPQNKRGRQLRRPLRDSKSLREFSCRMFPRSRNSNLPFARR